MTTHLRMIHRDDPAPVAAVSLSPTNPLAGVPEVARVWYDPSMGELMPVQPPELFWPTVRKTRLIFNSDLFARPGMDRRDLLHRLVRETAVKGLDPSTVTLITDWESWGAKGSGKNDFDFWYRAVSAWPGPIGNYGNAEGKHVEEHPGNAVALSWPWLRDIPNGRGVSCPSAYNLGLSVDGMRKTIAVAHSRRFYFWGKSRKVVAFICDPMYQNDAVDRTNGIGSHAEYLEAAQAADYIIHWPISALHDAAKYPRFNEHDRLEQDKQIARAIGVRG